MSGMLFTICSSFDVSDFCTSMYCSRFSEGSMVLVGRMELRNMPSPGAGSGGSGPNGWPCPPRMRLGKVEVRGEGSGKEVGVAGRLWLEKMGPGVWDMGWGDDMLCGWGCGTGWAGISGGTGGLPIAEDMEDTGVPGSDLQPLADDEGGGGSGGGEEALLLLGFSEDPWEEGRAPNESPSALDGDLPASLPDRGVSRGLARGLGEGSDSALGGVGDSRPRGVPGISWCGAGRRAKGCGRKPGPMPTDECGEKKPAGPPPGGSIMRGIPGEWGSADTKPDGRGSEEGIGVEEVIGGGTTGGKRSKCSGTGLGFILTCGYLALWRSK